MRTSNVRFALGGALLAMAASAPAASATTIYNPDGLGVTEVLVPGGGSPSSTDTLESRYGSGQATITTSGFMWGSGALLTNGSANYSGGDATTVGAGGTIDFDLGGGGWMPTSIDIFTSPLANDQRTEYDFTLSYSTVANPTVFTSFLTVAGGAYGTAGEVEITFPGSSPITGVETIRLTDDHGDGSQTSSFAEVDLNATQVPEPTTLALIGLGAVASMARSRRRRA